VALHNGELDKHLDYVKTIPQVIEPLGGTEDSEDGLPSLPSPRAANNRRAVKSQPQPGVRILEPQAKRSRLSTVSESSSSGSCSSKVAALPPSSDEETGIERSKPPRKRKRQQQQLLTTAGKAGRGRRGEAANSEESDEEIVTRRPVKAQPGHNPVRAASASPLKVSSIFTKNFVRFFGRQHIS
jgi:hypothetical protein